MKLKRLLIVLILALVLIPSAQAEGPCDGQTQGPGCAAPQETFDPFVADLFAYLMSLL